MAGLWRAYLKALDTNPITTKVITSGTLVALGDAISQVAVEKRKEYDFPRTLRMFTFGFAISGPLMHYWYQFLGTRITGTGISRGVKTMLVDQMVFAPSVIGLFFASTSLMEGKSIEQTQQKLKRDYLPALQGNYVLWPAAQLINFTFVPTKLAVLYVSGVALVWNTWLCYMNAKD